MFYLDGAHSPESMEACGKWFSLAIKEDPKQLKSYNDQTLDNSRASHESPHKNSTQVSARKSQSCWINSPDVCTIILYLVI